VAMVVGIFLDGPSVLSVIDGLKSKGADVSRLHVLACDDLPTELAEAGARLVWIGDVERDVPHGIITDAGGVSVPGLGSGGVGQVDGDDLLECLSELSIPDGRTDDYARAVEEGRIVVGYPGGADAASLSQLFSTSGATIVETF